MTGPTVYTSAGTTETMNEKDAATLVSLATEQGLAAEVTRDRVSRRWGVRIQEGRAARWFDSSASVLQYLTERGAAASATGETWTPVSGEAWRLVTPPVDAVVASRSRGYTTPMVSLLKSPPNVAGDGWRLSLPQISYQALGKPKAVQVYLAGDKDGPPRRFALAPCAVDAPNAMLLVARGGGAQGSGATLAGLVRSVAPSVVPTASTTYPATLTVLPSGQTGLVVDLADPNALCVARKRREK